MNHRLGLGGVTLPTSASTEPGLDKSCQVGWDGDVEKTSNYRARTPEEPPWTAKKHGSQHRRQDGYIRKWLPPGPELAGYVVRLRAMPSHLTMSTQALKPLACARDDEINQVYMG